MPAVLVASHGPFAWGPGAETAVENAIAFETVARVALCTLLISPEALPIASYLVERHYARKHGPASYYGQFSGAALASPIGSGTGAQAADDLERLAAGAEPMGE